MKIKKRVLTSDTYKVNLYNKVTCNYISEYIDAYSVKEVEELLQLKYTSDYITLSIIKI